MGPHAGHARGFVLAAALPLPTPTPPGPRHLLAEAGLGAGFETTLSYDLGTASVDEPDGAVHAGGAGRRWASRPPSTSVRPARFAWPDRAARAAALPLPVRRLVRLRSNTSSSCSTTVPTPRRATAPVTTTRPSTPPSPTARSSADPALRERRAPGHHDRQGRHAATCPTCPDRPALHKHRRTAATSPASPTSSTASSTTAPCSAARCRPVGFPVRYHPAQTRLLAALPGAGRRGGRRPSSSPICCRATRPPTTPARSTARQAVDDVRAKHGPRSAPAGAVPRATSRALARGDLGTSLSTGQPVAAEIAPPPARLHAS